jgi:hypothetical protein
MSEAVIGGGFASRVIFIYEETTRRRQLIYKGQIDISGLGEKREALISDLRHIDETIKGDFDITDEAAEFLETWYQQRKREPNKKLKGYHERKPAHMFKVAMLLHVAKSDDMLLSKSDFEDALSELELVEKKLARVFEGIGKNPYTFDMRDILEYVKTSGRISKTELLQHFTSAAPPSMLNELVEALVAMKQLAIESEQGGKLFYRIRE